MIVCSSAAVVVAVAVAVAVAVVAVAVAVVAVAVVVIAVVHPLIDQLNPDSSFTKDVGFENQLPQQQ